MYLVTTMMKSSMSLKDISFRWRVATHILHIIWELWPRKQDFRTCAHDSAFGDSHNKGGDDIDNQGVSVSSKERPSSSQCDRGNRMQGFLAASVQLIEVPHEYKIPVHSNSDYELRDTYKKNAIIAL